MIVEKWNLWVVHTFLSRLLLVRRQKGRPGLLGELASDFSYRQPVILLRMSRQADNDGSFWKSSDCFLYDLDIS